MLFLRPENCILWIDLQPVCSLNTKVNKLYKVTYVAHSRPDEYLGISGKDDVCHSVSHVSNLAELNCRCLGTTPSEHRVHTPTWV